MAREIARMDEGSRTLHDEFMALPAWRQVESVRDGLTDAEVLGCAAATGCGKSTVVPNRMDKVN